MKKLLLFVFLLLASTFSYSQIPSNVPTNGLVGWWPFNTNTNDLSGNGYDLINYNVTYGNDRFLTPNSSAYFSGNGSFLKTKTSFSQFNNSPLQTYAFWFKNVESNWRYILNYANESKSRIGIVPNTLATTKSIGLEGTNGCINCGSSGGIATINTPGLDTGWHHIVVAIDSNVYKVYYDGSLTSSNPHNGFNCVDSAFRFILGNDILCSPEYYNMFLDDIGVWNRTLNLNEVIALYNKQPTTYHLPNYVPTNGLVGWWPFNTNTNDLSGNGYDLINYNVTYGNDRFLTPNSSAYFSGNGSFLKTKTSFSQFNNSPLQTYAFWFKNVESNWRYILNYANESKSRIGIVPNTLATTKSIGLEGTNGCINCGSSGGIATINTPGLDTGWHHIVVAIDSNVYKVYYDGSLTSSNPHNGFNCVDSAFRFILGNDILCSPEYYNMFLDDIGVWNRTLTPQEITRLHVECSSSINLQPQNQSKKTGESTEFIVKSNDTLATYNWQTDIGLGFQNISNAGQYTGANNDTLKINNLNSFNNNQKFRCIVASSNICVDTTNVVTLYIDNSTFIYNNINSNIKIYPNPTSDIINIEGLISNENTTINIHDIQGKLILSREIKEQGTIDISEFTKGIYIIKIGEFTHRIVKM